MRETLRRFVRHKPALAGVVLLALVVAAALLAGVLYPGDPFRIVGRPFQPPLGEHPLGTDMLGRDLAAAVLYGARTTLMVGFAATLIATVVGVGVGGLAGYFGGRIDNALMRLTELFQTIPFFLFAILLVAVLGSSIGKIVFAIAVVSWPPMARLVRGEFLALRNREFVQACVSMGMGHARIIVVHILPNALSSIVVTGSLMVATAILIESGLSFLGLSDPNVMSWGFIIGAGRSVLRTAWWICAVPGVAILLTVMAINLVGDGLNDALNPRLRQL